MTTDRAAVLLSGGMDSTIATYWAKKQFYDVVTLNFNYGQKHLEELWQARKISEAAGCGIPTTFNVVGALAGSSLVEHHRNHNDGHPLNPNLPASFVPCRNMLFLTIAAGWCMQHGIKNMVMGVCQTDYSGYPDCRRDFIDSMENTLSYALDPDYPKSIKYRGKVAHEFNRVFHIHTPLMYMTKAEEFKLAKELGCLDVVINDSMTDYNGDRTMNEWGMGKEDNPASVLRAKGYREAKANGWL